MNAKLVSGAVLAACMGLAGFSSSPQGTPDPMADAYGSLADAILAVKATEANLVRTMLDGHLHAARAFVQRGDTEQAAAEMALFANEGDNAIGGVRKRLLEGGHHHNAAGEAEGVYEPGYVVVTRAAKEKGLALSAEMRRAQSVDERMAVWHEFEALAQPLVSGG